MNPRSSCAPNSLVLLFVFVGVFLVVPAEGARATSESCGDGRFGHEFTSLELYGISPSEGNFVGNPAESGVCGLSPFLGGDPEAAAGSALIQLPTVPGDLFGDLEISTQEGSLEAVVVSMHQPRNPDPETGRPRIVGAMGPCGLPTGPANPYYPDPDCLQRGASRFGEQSNAGLNEGFTGQAALIDATQFIAPEDRATPVVACQPGASSGGRPVPGNPVGCVMPENLEALTPVNNTPYFAGGGGWRAEPEPFCYHDDCLCGAGLASFLEDPVGFSDAAQDPSSEYSRAGGFEELVGAVFPEGYQAGDSYCVEFLPSLANDAYLEDPADPRNRYADPDDPLYQGEKFRAGLPTCDGSLSWDACVAPLYVPQLDRNNTPANAGSEFAYREDAGYSATRGDAAGPTSRDFYDSLCEASVDLSVENTLPLLQTELRSLLSELYGYFLGQECSSVELDYLPLYDHLAESLCPGLPLRSELPPISCRDGLASDHELFDVLSTCIDETWGAQLAADGVEEKSRMSLGDADVCLLESGGVASIGSSGNIPGGGPPLNVVFGKLFGGYPSMGTLAGASLAGTTLPLTENWHDYNTINTPGYGAFTAFSGEPAISSREMGDPDMAGCFDAAAANSAGVGPGRRCDVDDASEFMPKDFFTGDDLGTVNPNSFHQTLNAVLSPEQEALLGCGPFYENNCDDAGVSRFDGEASAVLQSVAPPAAGASSWRTDGLAAGAKVMVQGGLSKVDICGEVTDPISRPNGEDCEGPLTDNPLVTQFNSPYQGLTLDQIQMLFQEFLPNCSTWQGLVDEGVDCVNRAPQPGTIGSRDIGIGSLAAAGVDLATNGGAWGTSGQGSVAGDQLVFEPGSDFPNFEGDFAQPRCTTEDLGGASGQILPGCRNKWANYQDEMIEVTETIDGEAYSVLRANLNLFGRDRWCQDHWVFLGVGGDYASDEVKAKCFSYSDGSPLAPGQYLGGVYSPRDDLRSWDATKDGDPDYLGFDTLRSMSPSGEGYLHRAVTFKTVVAAGTDEQLPADVQTSTGDFLYIGGGNRCTSDQFLPADAGGTDPISQCSRFVGAAEGSVDPNQVVLAKGAGHPFTGQPWANELGGYSWNQLLGLVFTSAEYAAHKIPRPDQETDFPQVSSQPLAFATFDPGDPENAGRIAEIQANETQYCTSTASGYVCPLEIEEQNNLLRAQMTPICSYVTPEPCSHVQAMVSYTVTPPAVGDAPATRRWAWESGAEYRVTTASGVFAGVETVYASAPTTAPEENDEDFQMNLLLVTSIPEPAPPLLVTTALATLAALSRRKRSSRRSSP